MAEDWTSHQQWGPRTSTSKAPVVPCFPKGAARPSNEGDRIGDRGGSNRSDKGLNLSGSCSKATLSLTIPRRALATCPPRSLHLRHVPLGARGPYCGSAIGRRARASLFTRILT
ncbi:hypothetical protein Gotur_033891 [Gossypium turneri]